MPSIINALYNQWYYVIIYKYIAVMIEYSISTPAAAHASCWYFPLNDSNFKHPREACTHRRLIVVCSKRDTGPCGAQYFNMIFSPRLETYDITLLCIKIVFGKTNRQNARYNMCDNKIQSSALKCIKIQK